MTINPGNANNPAGDSDDPDSIVEAYQTPEDSGDADESFVVMQDSQYDETQEIIHLTDEIVTDTQSESREKNRSYVNHDNDLYKDISYQKYMNFNVHAMQNEPVAVSLDDIDFLDFDSDDTTDQVGVNNNYDPLRQEIDESFNSELKSRGIKAKIVTVTLATLAVGIVSYLLRAGSLVVSMMSALPLWRGFDTILIFPGHKKKLDCEYLQGYYFSRPMPHSEVADILQKQPMVPLE